MDFPSFKDDGEMADWFEENDVEPADLPAADEVVIAPDLALTLVAEVYSFRRPGTTSSANAAPTVAERRDLTLAGT